MKKLFSLLMLMIILLMVGCEVKSQTVLLDTTGLSPAVKHAIIQKQAQDQLNDKIESYGKWAGMGKEIGIAARDGLTAVKDVAVDLSESDLGKTVLFLIIWKVAGVEMIRIVLALLFAIVSIYLISKSYFKLFSKRRITKKTGWWIFGTKEYEYIDTTDKNGYTRYVLDGVTNSWAAGLHWFFLCIMLGISALIAFA